MFREHLLCSTCRRSLTSCKSIYCASCITSGQFTHSNPTTLPLCFSQMKVKLLLVDREIERDLKPCLMRSQRHVSMYLSECIAVKRQRVQWLEKCVRAKRNRVEQNRVQIDKLRSVNEKRLSRLPKYVHKVDQMRRCCAQFKREIASEEKTRDTMLSKVLQERLRCFSVLHKHIFHIEGPFKIADMGNNRDTHRACHDETHEYLSQASRSLDDDSEREQALLADAMDTSYSEGRWVNASNDVPSEDDEQLYYKVISSLIPASGNYDCCLQQWPVAPESPSPQSAMSALTHSVHLVGFLASLFDVLLPQHSAIEDSSIGAVKDRNAFRRFVAKLNLNVVHLCLSQGIRWELIRPSETVYNLKFLIDFVSMGTEAMDNVTLKSQVDYSQLGEKMLGPLISHGQLKTLEDELEDELESTGWEKLAGDRASLASWSSHGSSPPSSQSTVSSLAAVGGSKINVITSFFKGLARHN